MPIENTIDQNSKIIYSICTGVMTEDDFDSYVDRIWSHFDYYGFNELFNTVEGDWSEFNFGYLITLAEAASELKTIDYSSKLAWVVLEGKQKELTDFYKAARSFSSDNSRSLEAFYSKEDAMHWLKS